MNRNSGKIQMSRFNNTNSIQSTPVSTITSSSSQSGSGISWGKIIIAFLGIAATIVAFIVIAKQFKSKCTGGLVYDKNLGKCVDSCPGQYPDGQGGCIPCKPPQISVGGECVKDCSKAGKDYIPCGDVCINNQIYTCEKGKPCLINNIDFTGDCCPDGTHYQVNESQVVTTPFDPTTDITTMLNALETDVDAYNKVNPSSYNIVPKTYDDFKSACISAKLTKVSDITSATNAAFIDLLTQSVIDPTSDFVIVLRDALNLPRCSKCQFETCNGICCKKGENCSSENTCVACGTATQGPWCENLSSGSNCCSVGQICCQQKDGKSCCAKPGKCIPDGSGTHVCCNSIVNPVIVDDGTCCEKDQVYTQGGKKICCPTKLCYDGTNLTCCSGTESCHDTSICMDSKTFPNAAESVQGTCLMAESSGGNSYKVCQNTTDFNSSTLTTCDTDYSCNNGEKCLPLYYANLPGKNSKCTDSSQCTGMGTQNKSFSNCYAYDSSGKIVPATCGATGANILGGQCSAQCPGSNPPIWCPVDGSTTCVTWPSSPSSPDGPKGYCQVNKCKPDTTQFNPDQTDTGNKKAITCGQQYQVLDPITEKCLDGSTPVADNKSDLLHTTYWCNFNSPDLPNNVPNTWFNPYLLNGVSTKNLDFPDQVAGKYSGWDTNPSNLAGFNTNKNIRVYSEYCTNPQSCIKPFPAGQVNPTDKSIPRMRTYGNASVNLPQAQGCTAADCYYKLYQEGMDSVEYNGNVCTGVFACQDKADGGALLDITSGNCPTGVSENRCCVDPTTNKFNSGLICPTGSSCVSRPMYDCTDPSDPTCTKTPLNENMFICEYDNM